MITVFTPTYNRAYILNNLYESLVAQTSKNFEWLIVDDGSSDNTRQLVKNWILENKITIRFYIQSNGGKHKAINKGVKSAKGEMFFIVDSDDLLSKHSIAFVNDKYKEILNNESIGGISGRRFYSNGKTIGNDLPNYRFLSNAIDIRVRHKISGDMAEIYRTDVLKQYPFPEFEGEKFCPEALVWNRIAQKYDLLYFDEPIYQCEYLEDGLTSKITKIRMKSPQASMFHYSELESYVIPFNEKIKANINFWRFSLNSKIPFRQKLFKVSLFRSVLGYPIGFFFYLNDLRK